MNTSLSVSNDNQGPPDLTGSEPDQQIWAPLDLLAAVSASLAKWRCLAVEGRVLPSYVFIGPRGDRVPIRLALLASIEPEDLLSTHALVKLLVELELAPLLAKDFALFGYPVANPHRISSRPPDFKADFWKSASDPVIRYFEQELTAESIGWHYCYQSE